CDIYHPGNTGHSCVPLRRHRRCLFMLRADVADSRRPDGVVQMHCTPTGHQKDVGHAPLLEALDHVVARLGHRVAPTVERPFSRTQDEVLRMASPNGVYASTPSSRRARSVDGTYRSTTASGTGLCSILTSGGGVNSAATALASCAIVSSSS